MHPRSLARTILDRINQELGGILAPARFLELSNVITNLLATAEEQDRKHQHLSLGMDYANGITAYEAGAPFTNNPHSTGSLRSMYWERGWLDGLNLRKHYW
ncbi:MAG TPA: hypothetical protein VM553_09245 [Dongiaceae bacterium]|nr:hypothetical protein [Dongiaceae bacterium]